MRYIKTIAGTIEVAKVKGGYQISGAAKRALSAYGQFDAIVKIKGESGKTWVSPVLKSMKDRHPLVAHFRLRHKTCRLKHTPHTAKCIKVDFPLVRP